MRKYRKISQMITFILAVLALIGIGLSHLALTDIAHATEPDLRQEWTIVQISFLIFFLLAVSVVVNTVYQFKYEQPALNGRSKS